ncbi:histidinol-phosphatase (php family) [Ilyonectria robusta]
MGGKFTFSDDSHGIAQVATNYARTVTYLESLGIQEVWTYRRKPHPGLEGNSRAMIEEVSVPLTAFRESFKP